MKPFITSRLGLAGLGSLAFVGLGCGGVDDESTGEADLPGYTATNGDDYRRSRAPQRCPHTAGTGGVTTPPSATGGTGNTANGTAGTGNAGPSDPSDTTECAVCERAQACCETVSGGPLCTFSAATCESLDAVRQAPYVVSCKTLLDTVQRAWSTPPSSCR
jgi:hypothetical protein